MAQTSMQNASITRLLIPTWLPRRSGYSVIGHLSIAALLVLTSGCKNDDRLATYPVQGRVAFEDGSPLPGGSIICLADSEGMPALTSRGQIRSDGTFILGTYAQDDGALAGRHLVAIDPPRPQDHDPDTGPPPRVIHPRFQDPEISGLSFTVTEDGPNEVLLTVSKK